ncbi:unnamed protein product [Prorocentrum cordatum]|uniref:Uncharacterized protein n=1 Tax=Prorocentrum cordatum TaxID=2364126 RepID=A0ABN9PXD2_9DINO|nr:unnamed protein product [Polarella glacialis]
MPQHAAVYGAQIAARCHLLGTVCVQRRLAGASTAFRHAAPFGQKACWHSQRECNLARRRARTAQALLLYSRTEVYDRGRVGEVTLALLYVALQCESLQL